MTIRKGWNAADVCTTYWRFYINDEAGARIQLADKRYDLPPGHIHFIPAWVTFSCLNDRELNHFYIHFDLLGLSAATVRSCFPEPFSLSLDAQASALLLHVTNQAEGIQKLFSAKALVYQALSRVVAGLPVDRRREIELQQLDPFNGLMSFIENNLSHKLQNKDLARFCNLSEDHFIKRFRSVMKVSPNHYLNERRIARAAEHLIFSDETIDTVADRCGFPNRHYFTRVFIKFMGLPPAQFRKSSHP